MAMLKRGKEMKCSICMLFLFCSISFGQYPRYHGDFYYKRYDACHPTRHQLLSRQINYQQIQKAMYYQQMIQYQKLLELQNQKWFESQKRIGVENKPSLVTGVWITGSKNSEVKKDIEIWKKIKSESNVDFGMPIRKLKD